MVEVPGTNDKPTTDQPGINDTPTTDEPGNNDTLTVDEPGTNDTPTVNEKEFIIVNTKEKKTRTYLNEENELVTKKKNVHRSYSFNVGGNPVKFARNVSL
jgi:hypothetical protein